ncbi:hypothetical protein DEJ03_00325 [Curtobacterium sp. MCLR17_043]|uniref:hypothetical protein n=1 Tax=Curtobacterium sp. MCLR17_043 TaxID=2175627 RepID=UPI000D9F9B3A|nr:hypothetical protein [Curtobacterium sp. MCLR17_043]PYY49023.1 hypothetical protein DEJ03_00325 [Curtobacterium sp. MCLR17_043]
MTLLTTEWHPWFSYEWWSDIGTGLLGVVAATIVGGVTVWIALRTDRVARETVEFSKRVREADEQREERDRLRQAQLERISFAGLVRNWVSAVNEADVGPEGSENSAKVAALRTQLGDLAYDFDQLGRQELLEKIDAIVAVDRDYDEEPEWRMWWNARELRKLTIPLLIEGYVAGSHLPRHGLPADR